MNSRDWTIVLVVILGIFVLLPVLGMSLWGFGGMMGPGMMGRGMMGGYGWGGGFGLLVLALLVIGVVLILRGVTFKETKSEEPLDVLKRRLARGEITKEQYEELKQTLQ